MAVTRLMRDALECETCDDLRGIVQAAPLEGNIFEWHANIWLPSDAPAATVPLHLVLTFDEHYPSTPPEVLCTVRFPHANCYRKADGTYSICLDMLEQQTKKSAQPYSGWSSAMSVLSILLQLQSFLTLKKLHYAEGMGSMQRALGEMSEFVCPAVGCSHRGASEPWPAPRERRTHSVPRRLVCRPCGTIDVAGALTKPYAPSQADIPPSLAAQLPIPSSSANHKTSTPNLVKSGPVANKFAVLADGSELEASAAVTGPAVATPSTPSGKLNATASSKPIATALSAFIDAAAKVEKAAWAAHIDQVVAASKAVNGKLPHAAVKPCGKAALKNAQRARRRAERRAAQVSPGAIESPSPPLSKHGEQRGSATEDGATSTSTSMLGDDDTVTDEMVATTVAPTAAAAEAQQVADAACFGTLSYDALLILMERLHSQADVRALACTCLFLATACEDGLLWRVLFHKHYPASQISAATLNDWKYTYMLELSSSANRLTCFHSKAELGAIDARRKQPEVFGIPLSFTVNPRTQEVDYIYSSLDTLSYSAFADGHVRRTVWNEAFTHYLPLYLTREHFNAALPIIQRTIRDLCCSAPRWRHAHGRFLPEMALDVIPKLLCTMTVLLVDKGVAASDAFLDGFCQIYRLLLAMANEYPQLRKQVTRRVGAFIKSERARSKESEPNLGVLVPLFALCNGLRWCDLAWPLLSEMMDRAVLWSCRDHPELAKPRGCSQADLLDLSWSSRKVSYRLLMFSVGFLSRLAKISVEQLDDFHGQPSPWLRASMRQHMARTLTVDSWPAFFATVNVPVPPKSYVQEWIIRSVDNSVRKNYHKRGMDFSRVQRSGCSAILRKGESCACQPTMRAVRLEQIWRWGRGDVIYLDASALCYDFDGTALGFVDYSHMQSVTGLVAGGMGASVVVDGRARVALRHSGDVVDAGRKEGKHTIDIDLKALSDKVGSIFLTLSAWTTTLTAIVRPEIRCFDPDERSKEPLCTYELDGKPTASNTAVTMARIWRAKPGGRWTVTAIGELGMGRAGRYGPIRDTIRRQCFPRAGS